MGDDIKNFYTRKEPLVVFKWTGLNGEAPWGKGKWNLPKNGKRGAVKSIGSRKPIMCAQGIHGYPGVISLVRGNVSRRLFVAEIWGEVVSWDEEKVVGQHGCLCYELRLHGDEVEVGCMNEKVVAQHGRLCYELVTEGINPVNSISMNFYQLRAAYYDTTGGEISKFLKAARETLLSWQPEGSRFP